MPGSSPRIGFDPLNSLSLTAGLPDFAYSSGGSFTNSPARPMTPSDGICPPALSHLSGGELSSDSMPSTSGPSGRKGRSSSNAGTISPDSVQSSLPSRGAHRFNPVAARARKTRRATKDEFGSDDEDEERIPKTSKAEGEETLLPLLFFLSRFH